jgi:hypothetical protein
LNYGAILSASQQRFEGIEPQVRLLLLRSVASHAMLPQDGLNDAREYRLLQRTGGRSLDSRLPGHRPEQRT